MGKNGPVNIEADEAEQLVARFRGPLLAFFRRRVREPQDAEDLTQEVFLRLREGKSSTDIGTILGLSPRTVDAYIADACARLGVRTRMQAVTVATAKGLLPPSIP